VSPKSFFLGDAELNPLEKVFANRFLEIRKAALDVWSLKLIFLEVIIFFWVQ